MKAITSGHLTTTLVVIGTFSLVFLTPTNASTIPLAANSKIRKQISRNNPVTLTSEVSANTTYVLRVLQENVDLAFKVGLGDGTILGPFDGPLKELGWESALIETGVNTKILTTIHVSGTTSSNGEFLAELIPLYPETDEYKLVIQAHRLMTKAAMLDTHTLAGRQKASKLYGQALKIWGPLTATAEIANTSVALANLSAALERRQLAIKYYRQAYEAYQTIGDYRQAAWVNYYQAGQLLHLARVDQAQQLIAVTLDKTSSTDFPYVTGALSDAMGSSYASRGQFDKAVVWAERAEKYLSDASLEHFKANILHNLASANHGLGKTHIALKQMQRVLDMDRSQGNNEAMADTLESMGSMHQTIGECSKAISLYDQSSKILGASPGDETHARNLRRSADCYADLGEPRMAVSLYKQALEFAKQDLHERAIILNKLGDLHRKDERLDLATTHHKKSLDLEKQIGDQDRVVDLYIDLARDALGQNDLDRTLVNLALADQSAKQVQSPHVIGNMNLVYGLALTRTRKFDSAASRLAQAISIFERSDYTPDLIKARIASARLAQARNNNDQALKELEKAIPLVESSRAAIGSIDLRSAYFANVRDIFELKIELLLQNYEQMPNKDAIHAAWQTADQIASRSLFDVLEAGVGSLNRLNPDMSRQRTVLQHALTQQLAALTRNPHDRVSQQLKQSIQALRLKLDAIDAEIVNQYPELSGLTWERLDTRRVQASLAADQALLQYSIGDLRSYGWLVTRQQLIVLELPARSKLSEIANVFLQHLTNRQLLASDVLAEVSDTLINRFDLPDNITSLVVVPDGAIAYLPLGALKLPNGDSVIDRYDLSTIPSARLLLRKSQKPASVKKIAVVADPVYSPQDTRIPKSSMASESNRQAVAIASSDPMSAQLKRLPFTEQEARYIIETAPDSDIFLLQGFDATKTAIQSDRLSGVDVIHFAVHGLANSIHPELSGLVLSLVDDKGQTRDGFLGLQDIYALRTDASLVVLSACQTALGREIHGEGMISLARGFMRTGTSQVIASLWQVPDKATAVLMKEFYYNLLSKSDTPSVSLRNAQQSIRSQPKWREPFYWAGFSLWINSQANNRVTAKLQ